MGPLRHDRGYDNPQSVASDSKSIHLCGGKISRHFKCLPDRSGLEDVRACQLDLIAQKFSWSHLNQVTCALRFLYGVALGRAEAFVRIASGKDPEKRSGSAARRLL